MSDGCHDHLSLVDLHLRILSARPSATSPSSNKILAGGRPVSVADELAKLAKLKSDGIITEAEFEA